MQPDFDIYSKHILIVDDIEDNRDLIEMLLEDQGYQNLHTANDGKEAIEVLKARREIDLVLLDIFMPNMNGYEVLDSIKGDSKTADIPVIMISAHDKLESVIRCIEAGALDYITKPVEETFLLARVQSTLERKYLQDQQKALYAQIEEEKAKSERLLYQVLPESVATRLRNGESRIADAIDEVTVVFSDLVGFTALSSSVNPERLVSILNEIFNTFDQIANDLRLEKIKTIGDAYMVVGGIPPYTKNHALRCMEFAFQAQEYLENFNLEHVLKLHIRIGLHTGPAVAGVIGSTRFTYDLWGDTVNCASRMEEMCEPDMIQLSHATYELVKDYYEFQARGEVAVKGKGPMHAYLTSPTLIGHVNRSAIMAEAMGLEKSELGGQP
jgi:adenylate cyclase